MRRVYELLFLLLIMGIFLQSFVQMIMPFVPWMALAFVLLVGGRYLFNKRRYW